LFGTGGTVLCGLIKYISAFAPESAQFAVVMVGQIIGAIAQPFLIDGVLAFIPMFSACPYQHH
jgi:hypothetical protein